MVGRSKEMLCPTTVGGCGHNWFARGEDTLKCPKCGREDPLFKGLI